jgi:hypothetical protein
MTVLFSIEINVTLIIGLQMHFHSNSSQSDAWSAKKLIENRNFKREISLALKVLIKEKKTLNIVKELLYECMFYDKS